MVNHRSCFALILGVALALTARALEPKPGETVEFAVELPAEFRSLAGGGRPSAVTRALCTVAVPADFDPAKPRPVLIVSATSDAKYNSSRRLMARFTAPALAAGWVVVAADPDREVGPDGDTNGLRYALVKAALAALQSPWPAVAQSPFAFGGFSGGAKRSAWLAAMALIDGLPVIGVFQGGCNQATMSDTLQTYHPDRRTFLALPVFLSSGDADPIATPAQHAAVRRELARTGFTHLRLETFAGQHQVYAPHVTEALRWFAQLAPPPP